MFYNYIKNIDPEYSRYIISKKKQQDKTSIITTQIFKNKRLRNNNIRLPNLLEAFSKENIEEIYKHIIENANDLITIFNDRFEIEYINENIYKKLLGYSKSQLIGKSLSLFSHIDDLSSINELKEELFQKGDGLAVIRFRKNDNSYIWLEIKGDVFTNENNENKILTISRDITDHEIAQKIVEKENIRLNKLDELRKEFIARASHDIKNPLGSLILSLNMLKYKHHTQKSENLDENIDNILIQAQKVQNLAVNLLDYAMIETHRFQIKKEKIDVSKIILNCVKTENLRAKERGIDISYKFPKELVLYGDELEITRIFQNLISNAINYTQKYKKGKIVINAERNDKITRISIKDNGIGLKKEDINKLFNWEYKIQKDQDDIIEGSGIGLYITKQIINSHGGQIWVESDGLNRGSTFNIEFPIS